MQRIVRGQGIRLREQRGQVTRFLRRSVFREKRRGLGRLIRGLHRVQGTIVRHAKIFQYLLRNCLKDGRAGLRTVT